MPEALQKEPLIDRKWGFLWSLYSELSLGRLSGEGGPQPLQLSEINTYLRDVYGMEDPGRRKFCIGVLKQVDMAWLELQYEKIQRDMANATARK